MPKIRGIKPDTWNDAKARTGPKRYTETTNQDGLGGAGNTELRGLTTNEEWL